MNDIQSSFKDGVLTVKISGRIESFNAAERETAFTALVNEYKPDSVIIDAKELGYVSSAGLRVFLKILKTVKKMKLINVSSDLYEIFDVTGFTRILDIEKAYREVSVEGCKVIGEGANGRVYSAGDEIVKVYFDKDALPAIKRERSLAQTALVLGIPTAIPWDVVRVGDGYGSVFELLNAKSYADLIIDGDKTVDEVVAMSVDLLKKLHSTETDSEEIKDMKYAVLGWVDFLSEYLPEDCTKKLRRLVEAVPDNRHLLHGDFHIKNVLVQDGESLLIDMDTLCTGDPIFELGGIYSPYVAFSELNDNNSMNFFGIPTETSTAIWEKTLRLYLGTDDEERIRSVEDRAKLLAHMRIMRRFIRRNGFEDEKGKKQIEVSKNHIIETLDKVDSLML